MSERCPLLDPAFGPNPGNPVDVPVVCLEQCGDTIDEIGGEQPGYYDDFLNGDPIPDGEVEYSHNSIRFVGKKALGQRVYSVVDRVTFDNGEWIEISETSWSFTCAYSSQ